MTLAPGLDIDLRSVRTASEREGNLSAYALRVSSLDRELTRLLESQHRGFGYEVRLVPVVGSVPAGKSAAQVIDLITVALSPLAALGVAGCVKLVSQIVEACRAKIPTSYEIEVGGTKLKVSGPSASVSDLRLLHDMFKDLLDKPAGIVLAGRDSPVRIKALPKDR